jgi:hypothetical protein
MAAPVVNGGDLVVRLSPLEKICTFRSILGSRGFGRDRAFAAGHGRAPAVRVDLDTATSRFSQFLVTAADSEATAAAIMVAAARGSILSRPAAVMCPRDCAR